MAIKYNPDAPVDLQPDEWSCSVESAQWLLRALGRNPQDSWIRPSLLGQGIVTTADGLMDASGRRIVRWFQEEYGNDMGHSYRALNPVTWEQLNELAGTRPVMIGGRAWNHWSGVRRRKDGGLELANPAPNWKGTGHLLDKAEFDALGPFSAVTVYTKEEVKGPYVPGPTVPNDTASAARIKELEAQVLDLRAQLAAAASVRGYLTKDVAGALQAAVDELKRHAN